MLFSQATKIQSVSKPIHKFATVDSITFIATFCDVSISIEASFLFTFKEKLVFPLLLIVTVEFMNVSTLGDTCQIHTRREMTSINQLLVKFSIQRGLIRDFLGRRTNMNGKHGSERKQSGIEMSTDVENPITAFRHG